MVRHHRPHDPRDLDAARAIGAATAAIRPADTLAEGGAVLESFLDRSRTWAIQTPQCFSAPLLREAHRRAAEVDLGATDDAALVLAMGHDVAVVEASADNFKITTAMDMAMARALLRGGLRRDVGV